mmetsp:Transcript_12565/g.18855  ORF Transcript_12565/g.18855 Transcript_12565/m.18855 type:complete len:308 (+) Transcript_12565:5648-6571(+)
MSKLRIGKLVNRTTTVHAEVTPHGWSTTEVNLLNTSTRGLETGLGVLSGNAHSNTVTIRRDALGGIKINEASLMRCILLETILSVQLTNLRNVVQRDTHCNLKLRSRQVHLGYHLSHGVLYLQTGVQLKEIKLLITLTVKVFDGSSISVSDSLGKGDGSLFHLRPHLGRCSNRWSLLNDLLMTTLNTAITTVQCNRIAILISKQLNLQMPRVGGQFHDKNGTSWNLSRHLTKTLTNLLQAIHHTNTLSSTTLRRLNHNRKSNLHSSSLCLFRSGNIRHIVLILRQASSLAIILSTDLATVPCDTRHT